MLYAIVMVKHLFGTVLVSATALGVHLFPKQSTVVSPAVSSAGSVSAVAPPVADRVQVPAGVFIMGSDSVGEEDERPKHTQTVNAFAIDRVEVSRRNFALCVRAVVCTDPRHDMGSQFDDPDQPVVGVSWHQAGAYCTWVGARLPTEPEWEKAARGTDGRTFPWGEQRPSSARARYGQAQDTGHPDPVGRHPQGASPYGVQDMAGNVWEWTSSPYDPYAYRHPEVPATCESALASLADLRDHHVQGFTGTNPLPTTCERVLRGGSWNYGGDGLRSSNRVHHPPAFRINVAGFRCATSTSP